MVSDVARENRTRVYLAGGASGQASGVPREAGADAPQPCGVRLELLVRAYCHLCDDMREALMPLARARGCEILERDVDAEPSLESVWGDKVPVLLIDGREICHYRFDAAAFAAALAGAEGPVARQPDFR